MKIAVITGASSGMGKAFTKQIDEKYQELDEIWVIARKKEGLEGLKKEISKLRILPMDLTDRQALEEFSTLLKREKPCIQILVESAGMGIQKKIEDTLLQSLMCFLLQGLWEQSKRAELWLQPYVRDR